MGTINYNKFDIWNNPKKICGVKDYPDHCPACNSKVILHKTYIPKDKKYQKEVQGMYCRNCKVFYVKEALNVKAVLKDNIFAKDFTYNGEFLWNVTAREEEKKEEEKDQQYLNSTPSAIALVLIQMNTGEKRKFIIVEKGSVADKEKLIHYASNLGRELLSAAIVKERKRIGRIDGHRFKVVNLIQVQSKGAGKIDKLIPSFFEIRKDGGDSAKKSWNEEIVSALLYSSFTGRYEPIRVTYNKDDDLCYTSASLFRAYLNSYGKPGVLPLPEERKYEERLNELREQSILKMYGYSVSEKEGLSAKARWTLLEELVDLGLASVPQVVRHLNWLIDSRKEPRYYVSRNKWELDRDHILAYKVNPDRFLIVDDRNKK